MRCRCNISRGVGALRGAMWLKGEIGSLRCDALWRLVIG